MSDDRGFERSARMWLELGPTDAPDRVVQAALMEIETTPQDRSFGLGRFRIRSLPARVVAAALVLLAVGGVLLVARSGGRPDVGGTQAGSPSLSPSATPSPRSTSQNVTPTPQPWQTPSAKLVRFNSPRYAYSVDLPTNWTAQAATAELQLGDYPYDFISRVDQFDGLASELGNPELVVAAPRMAGPLSLREWEAMVRGWAGTSCSEPTVEDVDIGGEPGRLITWPDCPLYLLWVVTVHGDRAWHFIVADGLAVDDPGLRPRDRALLDAILPGFSFPNP